MKTAEQLREMLEEALAERDAGRRVIAQVKRTRAASIERARESRAELEGEITKAEDRYTRERERTHAAREETRAVTVARNQALDDAARLSKELERARAHNADLLTQVAVLSKRAGLEGIDLGRKGNPILHFRASVLALCAQLGIRPEYPNGQSGRAPVVQLCGVSLANDDAYVRAIFTCEERVGKLLDAAKKVTDAMNGDQGALAIAELRAALYGATDG